MLQLQKELPAKEAMQALFYLYGGLSLQFSLLLILGGRNDSAIKAVRV